MGGFTAYPLPSILNYSELMLIEKLNARSWCQPLPGRLAGVIVPIGTLLEVFGLGISDALGTLYLPTLGYVSPCSCIRSAMQAQYTGQAGQELPAAAVSCTLNVSGVDIQV